MAGVNLGVSYWATAPSFKLRGSSVLKHIKSAQVPAAVVLDTRTASACMKNVQVNHLKAVSSLERDNKKEIFPGAQPKKIKNLP